MSENLHVCLLNDSFPPQIDGVANAVTNYATLISREHGSASVVTPFYPDTHDEAFPFPVLRYPSLDTTELVGYRAGFPFAAEVLAKLGAMDFNLLHSHCPVASTILARTLRSRVDIPLVFTYHTKFDIDIANAIRGRLLQEGAEKLLVENISACDEVWVVSSGAGENLRSLGYEGDYIVMPNGVDLPRGRVSDEAVAAATAGFDLPQGVPLFLFVGRMMWYKGLRILLDALKMLESEGVDFRMAFIGGGGDLEEVKAYTKELGLHSHCFFVGPIYDRETIRAWYCRADLFLFPSTFDTNGLVVREAAACALGTLLVKDSCAAEGITHGCNGLLMEENAASMAAGLRALCARPETMREVGERAQRELYLSWEDSVRAACARYETVIDNYACGRYPPHREVTDEMLRAMAGVLESISRARSAGQSVRQELEQERQKRARKLEQRRERVKTQADELWQKLERFM